MSNCKARETDDKFFSCRDEGVKVNFVNENEHHLIIRCPEKENKKSTESSSGKRCDLLCRKTSNPSTNYYVEMKTTLSNSTVERAFDQLVETIKAYRGDFPGQIKAYIVYLNEARPKARPKWQQVQKRFKKQIRTPNIYKISSGSEISIA